MKWLFIILLIVALGFQQYKIAKIQKTQASIIRAIGVTTELIEILMFKTRYQR